MLVFAASDKGGTGRSVTSSNVVYRSSLQGIDVCYLDFDFGSPTSGAVFDVASAERGTTKGGLHSFLNGIVSDPARLDIWRESDRAGMRVRPAGAGRLVLFPGDASGGEFPVDAEITDRCAQLLLNLDEEFDICLVDLSAGRSYALQMVLAATAMPELKERIKSRWLVFHRWTRQHVIAASGLVYGEHGIFDTGRRVGHDQKALEMSLRFVHTAVVDPDSEELAGLAAEQITWLRSANTELKELASQLRVGRSMLLGRIPLDPVLQWREQIISDNDVLMRGIANLSTREGFENLAKRIVDDSAWETL